MRISIKLLVLGLALASCSSATNSSNVDNSEFMNQSVEWIKCPDDYFLEADYLADDFSKDKAVCTEVEVPVSYEDTSLGTLTVAMMGIGNSSNPFVFYNPGGPGASGIESIQYNDFPAVLDEEYFVVGFDPRGVGFSSPVRCDDEDDFESYFANDFYVDSQTEATETETVAFDFVEECAEDNPFWWSINTQNTVQDIEVMREVLTKAPLNFIGSSYGTTLAMEYLRAFPDKVGKLMLDSPVLIGLDSKEDALQQGKGIDAALERLFAACAEDAKCPGDSVMEVAELIKKKMVAADEGKVLGYWGLEKSQSNPDSTVASANLIFDGIFQMTYYELDDVYEEFRRGMIELIEKNDSWIFEFYGLLYNGYEPETRERSNSNEILQIVNCMDIDSREFDTEVELREFDAEYKSVAPLVHYLYTPTNGYFWIPKKQGCEWTWLAFEDDGIPDPPAKALGPVNESGKQLLIITSKGDNVTPYAGAIEVAEKLKSPLVVFEGTGHAVAFNGNKCLTEQITAFFSTGELPSSEVTCPDN